MTQAKKIDDAKPAAALPSFRRLRRARPVFRKQLARLGGSYLKSGRWPAFPNRPNRL
jgi:hypothetical protein